MLPKNGLEECIDACWQARHSCQKTLFEHCLKKGGEHTAPAHIELMISCMEICQTAADFMTRSSIVHAAICSACAIVCDACADSCEDILDEGKVCDDMQRCADLCRIAAKSCRTMGQETFPLTVAADGAQPNIIQ